VPLPLLSQLPLCIQLLLLPVVLLHFVMRSAAEHSSVCDEGWGGRSSQKLQKDAACRHPLPCRAAAANAARLPPAAELPVQQGTEQGSTRPCFRQPALGDCSFPTCENWVDPQVLDENCSAVVVNSHRQSPCSVSMRSEPPSPKEWGSGLAVDTPTGEKSHL